MSIYFVNDNVSINVSANTIFFSSANQWIIPDTIFGIE